MRARDPLLALALVFMTMACGAGNGSSGGPVEPPAPGNGANIIASSVVTFGLCTGPGAGCFYSQRYINEGPGCANNLHGKIRAYEEETLLESDDWWLDPSLVIRPGGDTSVDDCCFDQDTVRRRSRTETEVFWNNVPCS